MATSGSTSVKAMWDRPIYLKFSWNRTSFSYAGNYSVVNWSLDWVSEDVIPCIAVSAQPWSATVNGVAYSGTFNLTTWGKETKNITSGSFTITHDTNGNRSFTYSFLYEQGGTYSDASGSGTGVLNTIPRPAKLVTAPNFTDEENPAITYSNPLGNIAEVLEVCIANNLGNQVYVPYRAVSKTGTSYTFSLTLDERNALRAAATGSTLSVRFYIATEVEGTRFYNFLSRTMTLEDITPTLNPTVKDTDATIVALTGNNQTIISGFSDVYYTIGATPPSGTSIVSRSAQCGAQSSTANSGTFTNVDTNIFEFSATDSRGNVAIEVVEMDVIPYIKVTCNQTVRLNLDGTIALTVKGNCFTDSFGAANNTLSVQNRYREDGGEWSEWGALDPLISDMSNNSYTLNATISGFDPSGTYEFQSRAVDRLTSAESAVDSVTLKPIFDWGKYDFNFNVPLTIEGDPLADYVIEQGTEAMGTNGTWYWSKWKSGKAECYGCRNYGNMAVSTAWGGLYRSDTFTQDLPLGLFAETPEYINMTFRNADNYGGFIAGHEESAPTSGATGSFIVVRPASANLTQVYISFNVIGRWK